MSGCEVTVIARKKKDFLDTELAAIESARQDLAGGRVIEGVEKVRALKDAIHAAIPEKKRIGRGITWVVERIGGLFAEVCPDEESLYAIGQALYAHLEKDDLLMGAPIFVMAEYGIRHPAAVFEFFEQAAASQHWVVREFAAGGFHRIIAAHRERVLPWLRQMAQADQPNLRRFASETLRPVTDNRWISREPEYSLSVLRLLFREAHPYPRTSVGNNLSDLSRQQPELIFSIVAELVASKDENSYWIATRACRNLVKKEPLRVMDALGVDEYHYKERNFYR